MNAVKMTNALTLWIVGLVAGGGAIVYGVLQSVPMAVNIGAIVQGLATIYVTAAGLATIAHGLDAIQGNRSVSSAEPPAKPAGYKPRSLGKPEL